MSYNKIQASIISVLLYNKCNSYADPLYPPAYRIMIPIKRQYDTSNNMYMISRVFVIKNEKYPLNILPRL